MAPEEDGRAYSEERRNGGPGCSVGGAGLGVGTGNGRCGIPGAALGRRRTAQHRIDLRERRVRPVVCGLVRLAGVPVHDGRGDQPVGRSAEPVRFHRCLVPGGQHQGEGRLVQPRLHTAVEPGSHGPMDELLRRRPRSLQRGIRLRQHWRPGPQYSLRRPAGGGLDVPHIWCRILRTLHDGRRGRGARCRLRSVRQRSGTGPPGDDLEHLGPDRTPVVVRVLGRQPVRARRQGVPRDRRTDLVGPHADAGGQSGLDERRYRPPDGLRRAGEWSHRRIHHDPGLVLRNGKPGSAGGGRGRPADQPHRRCGAQRQRRHHPLRFAEHRGGEARSVGDAPVSVRLWASRADPGPRGQVPCCCRPVRGE